MRRTISTIPAACLALLTLTSSACVHSGHERMRLEVAAHHVGIQEAFQKALHAGETWERELWRAEYARRVRAYERYAAGTDRELAARAEFWRQLGSTAQQAGVLYLQKRLAD